MNAPMNTTVRGSLAQNASQKEIVYTNHEDNRDKLISPENKVSRNAKMSKGHSMLNGGKIIIESQGLKSKAILKQRKVSNDY
jgi:hypothetical protein